ncbi:MAG: type I-E CRISPR-associated protein Cas6/Cse3/CasE, partial [Bacteroidales bacterium]|nr:type I-E CRISPR-associated protein Cas6/Cse3/CasE [Bacteroidales bacterium]
MYLSKLELNLRSKDVRRDLADCYQMHRTLYKLVPDKMDNATDRVIYRIEDYNISPQYREKKTISVLIVSELAPDLNKLPDNYVVSCQQLDYKSKIQHLNNGDKLKFLLRANPTKKVDKKRISIIKYDDRVKWLIHKAENHGFKVIDVNVSGEGAKSSPSKQSHQLTFNSVVYNGILEIVEIVQFKQTLFNGIGSAKAFGFGLITI